MQDYLIKFEQDSDRHINEICDNIYHFYQSTGSKGFVIGMSGGLDCALVGALVARAGVPIIAVTMPFEAAESLQRSKGLKHAKELCEAFNIPLYTVDITEAVNSIYQQLYENIELDFVNERLAKANVLPRVRMTNLYLLAQLTNRLVIGTGNLSEITMGYFTKWGDGGYDYNPIRHLTKSEAYVLARRIGVPASIINKKPSADLWDDQSDETEMGISYADLDSYILTGKGSDKTKELVKRALKRNKHKYYFNLIEQLEKYEWLKDIIK
ncbi:MAG TPA: NAD(+) synthase [Erysipelotrichaceae bacterium]|mgnify:CR=1 FL=1|nr:NAD(+) synthase [Erysipelotrichaceae bacterium]HQB32031.1 NAD(+) synthase [Erysipelotrichaceae bacterium]